MQGELFPLKREAFLFTDKGPFSRELPSSSFIRLESLDLSWEKGKIDELKARVFFFDHQRRLYKEEEVDLKKGVFLFDNLYFHLKGNAGYVVTFKHLVGKNEKPFYMHYFLEKDENREDYLFRGKGAFERTPYEFEIKAFYPDLAKKKNPEPEAPGIEELIIRKKDKILGKYLIMPGQRIEMGEEVFVLTGVNRWLEFVISRDEGTYLFYAGSLFITLGSLLLGWYYLRS